MPMRDTIVAIANRILERIPANSRHGFDPTTEETEYELGRHSNYGHEGAEDERFDKDLWESVLFSREQLVIVLQYSKNRSYRNKRTQKITIHGHDYTAVRLCVYDRGNTPLHVRKQNIVDHLREEFPLTDAQNDLCCIEDINRPQGEAEFGHVFDLYIRGTGSWNIGADLTPAQFENASSDLVDKVSAALGYLLPVAQYYFENRDDVLRSAQHRN